MSDTVTLSIDGQEITVPRGTSLLEAAAELGIDIPVVCYHPHLSANGLCRVCSVDGGMRVQLAACVTDCQEGMKIQTQSENVRIGRRTILELLASTVDLAEERLEAEERKLETGRERREPTRQGQAAEQHGAGAAGAGEFTDDRASQPFTDGDDADHGGDTDDDAEHGSSPAVICQAVETQVALAANAVDFRNDAFTFPFPRAFDDRVQIPVAAKRDAKFRVSWQARYFGKESEDA